MKRIAHRVNILSYTSRRCLDAWLWLRQSHGIQWLVRSRDFELGCMGCLGSHPFYLHAFNILKLSDLATAPFVHPGWAVYSLVISLICKASGWIEHEHQKKNTPVLFVLLGFLRVSGPAASGNTSSDWVNRFRTSFAAISEGLWEENSKAQELT